MEDRLIRAASALNRDLFEQFNGSYTDFALRTVKAITRGGDPENYDDEEIIDYIVPILQTQQNEYTIQTEKLPCTIPYISFDVPNQEIDELKNALGGAKKPTYQDFRRHALAGTKSSTEVIKQARSEKESADAKFQQRYFERLEKYQHKYQELFDIDKNEWYAQFPEISYILNKEGMRNTYNLDDLTDNEFIPVFGDSNTFGMGTPEENIWYNQLNEELPIYNSGVISGTLMDVYNLLTSMYKTKKFKKAYVVIPHSERWNGVSENGYHEGISNGAHYFLKQFENIDAALNQNTRHYYRWMTTQALTNFCIINDIELHLWDNNTFATVQWCKEQDLHVPNWLFIYRHMVPKLKIANDCGEGIEDWPKHIARDLTHFGTEWHEKIAEYMLTNKPI